METKNIMIVGVGGQGILLTSNILGKMAIREGYDVKISEVHGMAQRGGSVVTFVRYGEKVAEPVVEEGCADILISFECLEAYRYAHFLKKDGVLIVNNQRINPITVVAGLAKYPENITMQLSEEHNTIVVDALDMAKKINNPKVLNTIIIGVAAKHLEFEKQAWLSVIEDTVPAGTIESNIEAFETGYSL